MQSIEAKMENLIEINKSKFISIAYPVFFVDEVKKILDELKVAHSHATHICYGYVVCDGCFEKCSDNGEPSGTAGKPILDVIKKRKLNNVLICVVRYFGGIKLGAGGLTRAYSQSASCVLDLCEIVNYFDYSLFEIYKNLKDSSALEKEVKLNPLIKDFLVDYTHFNSDKVRIQFAIKKGNKLPISLRDAVYLKDLKLKEVLNENN